MPEKILIVEDDLMNVKFMRTVLTKKGGFEVLYSEDPAEVLQLAREAGLTAIIMDIGLNNSNYLGEKIDGVRLTQLLKADPVTKHIPVILATAFAMAGDRTKYLEISGADGYVPKPIIDPSSFIETIRSIINSR